MKYSELFGRTSRDFPKDEVSTNAKLLIKGGFIDKLMAGSYTLLPLGFRVLKKIENIIREEINATGANELLMPLLHPKEIWNETGRWESAKDVMYQFEKDHKEYALSFTHEEVVMDLLRKRISSFKDLPVKVYHFSTKFRDEPRAKSGILRGREFLMKDLYSAHVSEDNMMKYYGEVIESYKKIFKRLGLDAKVVEAGGGVFTDSITHEFQVLSSEGEDTIFYCDKCDFAQNKDLAKVANGDKCPNCDGKIIEAQSIEVGNIFPLGTMYSEKMRAHFTDNTGAKKPIWLASYGIGPTRVLGTLVEVYHDEKGILWPESVAPFAVYLVSIKSDKKADEVYEKLQKENIEVLYDDRDVSPGEKLNDADLIGMPFRLVVSEKTGGKIEFKKRNETESDLLGFEEVLKQLKA